MLRLLWCPGSWSWELAGSETVTAAATSTYMEAEGVHGSCDAFPRMYAARYDTGVLPILEGHP